MAWDNWHHYGKYEPGQEPLWFRQWQRKEIARVRECQRKRMGEFMRSLRVALDRLPQPPVDIGAARAWILDLQQSGVISKLQLRGDRALARLLERAGLRLEVARTCASPGIKPAHDRVLTAWAAECIKDDAETDCELALLDDYFYRWAVRRGRDEEAARIGPKRIAAWLRAEGYQSVRRNTGIVFLGIACRVPK